jgi:hypothetical protein
MFVVELAIIAAFGVHDAHPSGAWSIYAVFCVLGVGRVA